MSRPLPGGLTPEEAAAWVRIRRYAVPGWMIERATAHRLAGDWRAACATAAVDVTFDPDLIAERHGDATAEALQDDLRHFAPDLLRWHLPRTLGGRTSIACGLRIVLAVYGTEPDAPALSVVTGAMFEGPQRLRLECAPPDPREEERRYGDALRVQTWTAARPFWDARRSGELRARLGGGGGRLPFFRPDGTPLAPDELPASDPGPSDEAAHAEWIAVLQARDETAAAYAAAGIDRDLTMPEASTYGYRLDPEAAMASPWIDLSRLAPQLRALAAAGAGRRFRLMADYRGSLALELAGPAPHDRIRIRAVNRDESRQLPALPVYAWQRLPDLELVRTGRITPQALHPLVGAALFPGADATGPSGPQEAKPVRVRCRGVWHVVRAHGGLLDLPEHTPEEQQRERAMRAFGGAVAGCFAVQQTWTTGEGRLPRALRAERADLFLRALHGDTPGVVALLDAGMDPRVRDGRGRTLLHMLHLLDHEVLLGRLLAAGVDLEAEDKTERTPLLTAVHQGGSPDLVRAFLAAGARIDVTDQGLSLAQMIRRYKRTDLTFLRSRVNEEFPDIGSEWFDDYMDEREEEEEEAYEAEGAETGTEEDDV